jgi:hypothetical protein
MQMEQRLQTSMERVVTCLMTVVWNPMSQLTQIILHLLLSKMLIVQPQTQLFIKMERQLLFQRFRMELSR